MAGTSRKNGLYEAGKLASDIAYIKAGIVDLNEKFDRIGEWRSEVDVRSETNAVRIAAVEERAKTQSDRMDAVLRESRWTGGISGVASVVAAAVVAVLVGPKR